MFLSLVLVMGTIKTISNDENGGPEGPRASQGCIVSIWIWLSVMCLCFHYSCHEACVLILQSDRNGGQEVLWCLFELLWVQRGPWGCFVENCCCHAGLCWLHNLSKWMRCFDVLSSRVLVRCLTDFGSALEELFWPKRWSNGKGTICENARFVYLECMFPGVVCSMVGARNEKKQIQNPSWREK